MADVMFSLSLSAKREVLKLGCNRTPTELENRQIQQSASNVAAICGADLGRAENYVRMYGELGAIIKLNSERGDVAAQQQALLAQFMQTNNDVHYKVSCGGDAGNSRLQAAHSVSFNNTPEGNSFRNSPDGNESKGSLYSQVSLPPVTSSPVYAFEKPCWLSQVTPAIEATGLDVKSSKSGESTTHRSPSSGSIEDVSIAKPFSGSVHVVPVQPQHGHPLRPDQKTSIEDRVETSSDRSEAVEQTATPQPPESKLRKPSTSIEQRTAPADSNYFTGPRFIDSKPWNEETGILIYRDQNNNRVLSVEGWIQPTAFEKGTSSLTRNEKETIKGPFAGDGSVHLAHCWAKCFGGPLLGNLEPFEGDANIEISVLEYELRKIVDSGVPLYVQAVFHWDGPDDRMPIRHELAVFARRPDGSAFQVGCFAVDADGEVHDLPYTNLTSEVKYVQ